MSKTPLLKDFRRIVVKVGSSLLVDSSAGGLKRDWLASLAADVAGLHRQKCDVLVVSSGAIALGRAVLKLPPGALKLEDSQAAAAVGQIALARAWSEALGAHSLTAGQVLVDSRDEAGRGYVLRTTDHHTVRFEMCDGWQAAYWDCDDGLPKTNTLQHLVVIVDGHAKAICFVVDGALNDGGAQRQFGFGRFNPTFKDISGGRNLQIAPDLHGELQHLRVYDRALRTSEAVGNFHTLEAR